jgi:hypothetical protein
MTDYEQQRIDKLIAKNMIYEARITQQDEQIAKLKRLLIEGSDLLKEDNEENAKLKRLLATACYLLEHTYNDIPTTIRDNNELKQWYEEHKKENK